MPTARSTGTDSTFSAPYTHNHGYEDHGSSSDRPLQEIHSHKFGDALPSALSQHENFDPQPPADEAREPPSRGAQTTGSTAERAQKSMVQKSKAVPGGINKTPKPTGRKGKPAGWSAQDLERALDLRSQGLKHSEIAKMMGRTRMSVCQKLMRQTHPEYDPNRARTERRRNKQRDRDGDGESGLT